MAIQPPQRFELDDLTHVEREARTIYAPGATPGDVLVVQSDHSLIAAPGGGSIAEGVWHSTDVLFTEEATAGVYTAGVPLPAGTLLTDILTYALGLWASDIAALGAADGGTYGTVIVGYGLAAAEGASSTYRSAFPPGIQGNGWTNMGTESNQTGGAYVNDPANGGAVADVVGGGLLYLADDVLTLTLTTTIGTPPVVPTGSTLVKIVTFSPVTAIAATFA